MKGNVSFVIWIHRKIFPFADVPNLLKLLRNHILDQGLRLPDGTTIDRDLFYRLLQVDNAELRLCYFLRLRHLTVSGKNC